MSEQKVRIVHAQCCQVARAFTSLPPSSSACHWALYFKGKVCHQECCGLYDLDTVIVTTCTQQSTMNIYRAMEPRFAEASGLGKLLGTRRALHMHTEMHPSLPSMLSTSSCTAAPVNS